jgi:hypothetical protein
MTLTPTRGASISLRFLCPILGVGLVNEKRKAREPSAESIIGSIKNAILGEPASDARSPDLASSFNDRLAREVEGPIVRPDNEALFPIASQENTAPLLADDARMSIGESFAALTKAAQLDDVSSKRSAKENTMDAVAADGTIRPLSQIEKDLLAAEAQFSEAEARRQQAESDASAALDSINKYQAEIDAAIGRLRQISPAGSNWSAQVDRSSNTLALKEEIPGTIDDPVIRLNYSAKS